MARLLERSGAAARGRCALLALVLSGCPAFYADAQLDVDGDGFTPEQGDCDDRDATAAPDRQEQCGDGVDNDCDGSVDGADPDFADMDGDGVDGCADCGPDDPAVAPGVEEVCDGLDTDCDGRLPPDEVDGDGDGSPSCEDCDDGDPDRRPGAAEICDGVDTDCDGLPPEEDPDRPDADGDGAVDCGDCDDEDPDRSPAFTEVCDRVDNDCRGGVPSDEEDGDGDGFAPCEGDCADSDEDRHPDAVERCNGIDDRCAGAVPEDELDGDGDGRTACNGDCGPADALVFPGAPERCNGIDDDCDLLVDEPDPTGALELLATAGAGGELDLWLEAGSAEPSLVATAGGAAASPEVRVALAGDLDGDSVVETLRGEYDPSDPTVDAVDRVTLLCGGGYGARPVTGIALPGDQLLAAAADLDGDGDLDLLSVRADAPVGELRAHLNDGLGAFVGQAGVGTLLLPAAGAYTLGAGPTDHDGDAVPDLVECGGVGRSLCRLHPGVGDGSFGSPGPEFDLGSPAVALAQGDFDGDQLADLLYGLGDGGAGEDAGALYLAAGDGAGGFAPGVEVLDLEPGVESGVGAGRGWIRVGDFDGDGELDLALLWDPGVQSEDRALATAFGDGQGGFTLGLGAALVSESGDPAQDDSFAAPPP